MLICPTCKTHFEGEEQFCPQDGSPLAPATRPPAEDPLLGRVLLGRYRLAERLGMGGMGTVYRALHTLMDKPVAIKVLRAELALDSEAVARFHREARSASRLDHDHCIRVTDFGQSDDGLLFLVMELLDGVSLGTVARRGPLPAGRVATIGIAIAEALGHAHEQGVIHRDLKPDNVFLARRAKGRELVKVLDFGLAKLAHDSALGPSITRDGTVFGTPEYMAPEQAEGEKLDGRTDLYALGCILYQLLVGDVPFRAQNFVALLTKHVTEPPEPPRERRPDLEISVGIEEVVLRCLAKKREARYETAQELADALAPFAADDSSGMFLLPTREGSGARPLPTAPPAHDSPRPSPIPSSKINVTGEMEARPARKRRLAISVGAVALFGVGIVALAVTRKPAPTPIAAPVEAPITPLQQANKLIVTGDLERAEELLRTERARADSVAVQESLADVAERRGNRLGALAHRYHAMRLSPKEAAPRAHLAALLYRLGHLGDACRQARAALALVPSGGPPPDDARTVLAQARCKEAP